MSVEPALKNRVVLVIDPAARPQGRSGSKMNVHPFSGRTERPRASIGLAGSRSSIDQTPRSSSPSLTSSNLKAERRKIEAEFRSSDNRRSGKRRLMCAIRLLGDNDPIAETYLWPTVSICPFNKREDSRI
jgi:hypothetical protein